MLSDREIIERYGGSYEKTCNTCIIKRRAAEDQKQQQQRQWKQLPAEMSMIGATVLIFGTGNIGGCTAMFFRVAGAERIIGVRRKPEHVDVFDENMQVR